MDSVAFAEAPPTILFQGLPAPAPDPGRRAHLVQTSASLTTYVDLSDTLHKLNPKSIQGFP